MAAGPDSPSSARSRLRATRRSAQSYGKPDDRRTMRIAVGGFEHETNTFAPVPATYRDFAEADQWPALSRGEALFEAVAGINLPVTGFIDEARQAGIELVPLLWCSAVPSGRVSEEAYERIAAMLLDDLERAGPLDALYLDLHGAMVAEHVDDGEGELLRRMHTLKLGLPIFVSLDLHANVTGAMMDEAAALIAFRTYPHIDMAETGARTARELVRQLSGGPAHGALRKLEFLIPVPWGCTMIEPGRSIYRKLAELEGETVPSLSFAPGFPLADIAESGPAVFGYGTSRAAIEDAVATLADFVAAREGAFAGKLYTSEEAVELALRSNRPGPVMLADTQDNPGGGGNSDTVGLLRALIEAKAQDAVLAILFDPEVAQQAAVAGIGSTIRVRLGAKSGFGDEQPFEGDVAVEKVTDGRFTATGPMYRGSRVSIGPMVLLRIAKAPGVRVVVSSRKFQAADRSIFRHLGIAPERMRVLALKSSVHFRADFEEIAAEILIVEAPGPHLADTAKLPFKKLRKGVRTAPLGKSFADPLA